MLGELRIVFTDMTVTGVEPRDIVIDDYPVIHLLLFAPVSSTRALTSHTVGKKLSIAIHRIVSLGGGG